MEDRHGYRPNLSIDRSECSKPGRTCRGIYGPGTEEHRIRRDTERRYTGSGAVKKINTPNKGDQKETHETIRNALNNLLAYRHYRIRGIAPITVL